MSRIPQNYIFSRTECVMFQKISWWQIFLDFKHNFLNENLF